MRDTFWRRSYAPHWRSTANSKRSRTYHSFKQQLTLTNNLIWSIYSRADVDVGMWGRPRSAWKHKPNNMHMCRHHFWGPPRRMKTMTRMKTKMERSPRRRPRPSRAAPPLASICLTMWNVWKVTTFPCSKLSAMLDASPFYTSWNCYTSS